jgi:hypothetical protein
MTDYRTLSKEEKNRVDEALNNDSNYNIGYKKSDVIDYVHNGYYCAKCWRTSWTCLCSHDN